MDVASAIKLIKTKLAKTGGQAEVPLLKGESFKANLVDEGIMVDNLGPEPFLPWVVFEETVSLLLKNAGQAARGDAMKSKLGEPRLPLNSVEGHVARTVYNKKTGDSVFRRITPIACILIWAGACVAKPKKLVLKTGH